MTLDVEVAQVKPVRKPLAGVVGALLAGSALVACSSPTSPVATPSGTTAAATQSASASPQGKQGLPAMASQPKLAWSKNLPSAWPGTDPEQDPTIGGYQLVDLGLYDPRLRDRLLLTGRSDPLAGPGIVRLLDARTGNVLAKSAQPWICEPIPVQDSLACRNNDGVTVLSALDLTVRSQALVKYQTLATTKDSIFVIQPLADGMQRVASYDSKLTLRWERSIKAKVVLETEPYASANESFFTVPYLAFESGGSFVVNSKTGEPVSGLPAGSADALGPRGLMVTQTTATEGKFNYTYFEAENGTPVKKPGLQVEPTFADQTGGLPKLYASWGSDRWGPFGLAAYASSGSRTWSVASVTSSVSLVGGALVFATDDKTVAAYDPADGKELWTREIDAQSAQVTLGDGSRAFLIDSVKGTEKVRVRALAGRTGDAAWQQEWPAGSRLQPSQSGLLAFTQLANGGIQVSLWTP